MDRMDCSLRRHGQAMVLIAVLSGGVAGSALGLLASARPTTVVAAPVAAPGGHASKAAPSTTAGRSATSSSAHGSQATASSSASQRSEPLHRPNRGGQAQGGKAARAASSKPAKGNNKGDGGGHH